MKLIQSTMKKKMKMNWKDSHTTDKSKNTKNICKNTTQTKKIVIK